MLIDGRGYGNDKHVAGFKIIQRAAVGEVFGLCQLIIIHFQRAIVALLKFRQTCVVDIKPQRGVLLAEFDGEGQAYVAEADDGEVVHE